MVTENSVLGLSDTANHVFNRNNSQLTIKGSIGKRQGSKASIVLPNESKTPRVASSVPKYSTIQPKPIVFNELHKKTYFNALERMLMSPSGLEKAGFVSGS